MIFRNLGTFGRRKSGLMGFDENTLPNILLNGDFTDTSLVNVDGSNYVQDFTDDYNAENYAQAVATNQPLYQNSKEFYFDGNDYIDLSNLYTTWRTNTTGTMFVRYKPDSVVTGSGEFILTFGDNTDSYISIVKLSAGTVFAGLRRNGVADWSIITDNVEASASDYISIALVQNGTEPIIYIDGVAVAQTFTVSTNKTTWLNTMNTNGYVDNLTLGARNTSATISSYCTGKIAQPFYSSDAYTAEQVVNLHNSKAKFY